MSTIPQFTKLLNAKGSAVRYRRNSDQMISCPCKTPEGFRNPRWHLAWKSLLTLEPRTDHSGVDFAVVTEINYRVYALADDGASGALVGPPAVAPGGGTGGVPYSWAIYMNATIKEWAYFQVARSIDGGPFLKVNGNYNFSTGIWTDTTAPGSEGAEIVGTVPTCNEEALVEVNPKDFIVKGFVQPIQSTRATRLNNEILTQMFGEVQADDHLGILPCEWQGQSLDFRNWSQSGDEFVEYDGRYYLVVNSNKIPDPSDGNPGHHWEVGLRLISQPLD
jgi:hypothetical protein